MSFQSASECCMESKYQSQIMDFVVAVPSAYPVRYQTTYYVNTTHHVYSLFPYGRCSLFEIFQPLARVSRSFT